MMEPWREYFRDRLQNAHRFGDNADRFEQYLARFQESAPSVYVADLVKSPDGPYKWQTGVEHTNPRNSEMDGGFRNYRDLDNFLRPRPSEDTRFRMIAVDATSTEVIQILGQKYNMAPDFFENRAYSGRKSHMSRLWSTQRYDDEGIMRHHCYMVIEATDYVWLGDSQPQHLHMADRAHLAFEFETPYQEGDYPWFHPALLWQSALTMASMPRKISFYLITGGPGTTTYCFVFLETIARAKAGAAQPRTLHLASREGTTVVWQQNPVIRGMYFLYFLFDCFGSFEPQPWDSQAYHSSLGKTENNRLLATDGRWAIVSFFRTLLAIGEFNLVGWSQRLEQLGEEAMASSDRDLARTLHGHLDDIYFHQEKFSLVIRVGRKILSQTGEDLFKSELSIAETLEDIIESAEHSLLRYDRFEKKIMNTIGMIFNSATIDEAHSSQLQTRRVGFLTVLAALFIPLSYISTLFGMNVRELQSATTVPSISLYFATAIPATVGVFSVALIVRYLLRRFRKRRVASMDRRRVFFIDKTDEAKTAEAKGRKWV